ncbi:MAG: hypothetical protein KDA25_02705 [Phycisphaerales bacterium]|nr:hypothetical protein [Phycisphaerales bacterium]
MTPPSPQPGRRRYVPVVGPRLRRLLAVVFALFALLAANSAYLGAITFAGWLKGFSYENLFYLWMMVVHLGLGLLITLPVIIFGILHLRNARNRPNRRAIRVGYGLFAVAIALLVTGYVLMRMGDVLVIKDPTIRRIAYWLHVICPFVAAWLFVLHRLAGRRIKWRVGLTWASLAGVFITVMLVLQTQDPRLWNVVGNPKGDQYFQPSLARTVSGNFIPARVLDNDKYCLECHADIHDAWSHSVHRFSSFNNPPYFFSVRETRRAVFERDGSVQASRFCAGCHDPVPFFSGGFDDPKFDDPDYDLASDPLGRAGVTCTSCHAITHVNSPRGNSDFTIDEPIHYPFTFSENGFLKWVNRQLVKAKPDFHKKTFLKPLHRTAEFCGTCHKVHLPEELNGYKWLRGQNHYDAFLLSGVSGFGVTSFYYPPKAETNCNGCHMPTVASNDFGAKHLDDSGTLKVHDHLFPSANTAIPTMVEMRDPEMAIAAHREFLTGSLRVDLFGVREDGAVDGALTAPLRPEAATLVPGRTYLLETVIRTMRLGHIFTQGTADSNEVWLDITVRAGDRIIGRSGGLDPTDRTVDPWSHFVNAFVLDRDGYRINRRNAQDIFTPLYNNQIPPGAADIVHYRLAVPADVDAPIDVEVHLRYRKFDTEYMRLVTGDERYVNDLPIVTIASDTMRFAVAGVDGDVYNEPSPITPDWQRWNDYGIALLRTRLFRQAEEAFRRVEAMGRPDGPVNLARVYIDEGRVDVDAPEALRRAANFDPPANPWSIAWFGAQIARRNGDLDRVVDNLMTLAENRFPEGIARGFDFSHDYRVLAELGSVLYQRALLDRGETRRDAMREAGRWFEKALAFDPEMVEAHYGLQLVSRDLGDHEAELRHAALHAKYKPDDNARDRAVRLARDRYPAASHAAEDVVIHDLQRPDAFELPAAAARPSEVARHDR